jgi:squalene-hopene/tetraprenyl-beta-curcumene cyclase
MTLACPRLSRLLGGLVGVFLLTSSGRAGEEPPDLPKPAATKANEPLAKNLSLAKGAEFLDRAVQWAKAQGCASCHTSYPFLMARPLLGDPKAPALVWMRDYLERRVAGWDKGKKGAGLPDEEDEAVTEIVATAATRAFDDARGGKLNPLTRQALDRMWTVQRKDGSPPFCCRAASFSRKAVAITPTASGRIILWPPTTGPRPSGTARS